MIRYVHEEVMTYDEICNYLSSEISRTQSLGRKPSIIKLGYETLSVFREGTGSKAYGLLFMGVAVCMGTVRYGICVEP